MSKKTLVVSSKDSRNWVVTIAIAVVLLSLLSGFTARALTQDGNEVRSAAIGRTTSSPSTPTAARQFRTLLFANPDREQNEALTQQGSRFATAEKANWENGSNKNFDPSIPTPQMDEQLGLTFTQNFNSISYNVTAVAQNDSYGYGPSYLLNGLSNQGYWYQVGLAWDWPYQSGGYDPGFNFIYEVFDSSGTSIYPSQGGGGLSAFSGTINNGDSVEISLDFSNNNVTMHAYDWNTGAFAVQSYSAESATYFQGLTSGTANSNGFFTGLMTEEYHVSDYYGNEQAVVYSDQSFALSSAWMWIDEFNVTTRVLLFGSTTQGPVSYSDPIQLQDFSSNGATEASDAYDFVTGSSSQVMLTFSYSVSGGGSSYSAPTLSYISNGVPQMTTLTTSPSEYMVDSGTNWSVTNPLLGSTSMGRWATNQTTNGTALSSETVSFNYQHEYEVSFSAGPPGTGSVSPSTAGWYDAGVLLAISATANPPYFFASWTATPPISIASSVSPQTTATINGPGTVAANFATLSVSLNSSSGAVTQGASVKLPVVIFGLGQTTDLSVTGLPSNVTTSWSTNPVNPSTSGTLDTLTIDAGFSSSPASYQLTMTADVPGNATSSINFSLLVRQAEKLTLNYTILGGGSGYSSPSFSYTYNGAELQVPVNASTTIYADQYSEWSVSVSLGGSSGSERWEAAQSTTGNVTSAEALDFAYFHQFFVDFNYSIAGGGQGYSAPTLNYTQFREVQSLASGRGVVWVDASSQYTYSNPLAGSSENERWEASSASGIVSSSANISLAYYNQFAVQASFSVIVGSDPPSGPNLTTTAFGQPYAEMLTTTPSTYWIDSGVVYSVANPLNGSASERWLSNSTSTAGIVLSPMTLNVAYAQQYYVDVQLSSPDGGTVSPTSSWVDSRSTILLSSSADPGWRFEGWTGSYTGSSNQTILPVNGPMAENASFFPGITISVLGADGSVSYSYGSVTGSVSAGPQTIYLPVGTNVSLSSSASFPFYKLYYWTGGTSGNSSRTTVVVNSSESIEAHFGYNLLVIGGLAAIIVAVVGAVLALRSTRSKRSLVTDGARR